MKVYDFAHMQRWMGRLVLNARATHLAAAGENVCNHLPPLGSADRELFERLKEGCHLEMTENQHSRAATDR
jgi:hypothetical protein